jgi:uncharacterized membrane protein YtjA (UPF0391 family)
MPALQIPSIESFLYAAGIKKEKNITVIALTGDSGIKNCQEVCMLGLTLTLLLVALVAGLLGFTGVAGVAAGLAKIVFVIFLVLFVLSLVFGRRGVV